MSNHLRKVLVPLLALAAGAALALGGIVPAFAAGTTKVQNVIYTVNSDGTTASVTGYLGLQTNEVDIQPTVVINGSTYRVTAIENQAFQHLQGIHKISIPDGIKVIGSDVFNGDTGLKSIVIPDSVALIDDGAFDGDSSVTSLTLGAGVQQIYNGAFNGLDITTVTIPATINGIGDYAFASDPNLTSVYFLGKAPLRIDPIDRFNPASHIDPLGSGSAVTVYYFPEFATPGGFTTPEWEGYRSQPMTSGTPSQPLPIATLPQTDSLYSFSCPTDVNADGQLLSVDPVSGESTPVGNTPSADARCGMSAAWDASNSTAYFETAGGNHPIDVVNLRSGAVSRAFQPTLDTNPITLLSFTITSAGDMYGMVQSAGSNIPSAYSIESGAGAMNHLCDLTTGALAIGPDPMPDTLYVLVGTGSDGSSYTTILSLDVLDLSSCNLSTLVSTNPIYSPESGGPATVRVDSSGQIWIEEEIFESEPTNEVWVVDPSDYGATPQWALREGGPEYDAYSLMITPKLTPTPKPNPTLAFTGVAISPVIVPLALLALGAGASLIVVGRVHRRRRRARQPSSGTS